VYLIDTNVLSELRKGVKANSGVRKFFQALRDDRTPVYVSVITIGGLRRGVEMIRHRGDAAQARMLEGWLSPLCSEHSESILSLDEEMAQVWGRLSVPHHENLLDKQIAATALIYDLTVLTRNVADFEGTGVRLFNPFSG
jgi:predicted nucleic acid-binding protein